jgi:hypothetical protein
MRGLTTAAIPEPNRDQLPPLDAEAGGIFALARCCASMSSGGASALGRRLPCAGASSQATQIGTPST